MTTGLQINGIDVATIFGPKGTNTAAATGWKSNGTDLNALLLAHQDGQALTTNTGAKSAGSDLINFFAAPQTSLPINGQTFSAHSQSATATSTCQAYFQANTTSWAISGSASAGGGYPSASGSVPSGATAVKYSYTTSSQVGSSSASNGASSNTALSSSPVISVNASSTPSSGDNHIYIAVTVIFYNSGGSAISTTTFNLQATATGSA